ncbi:peptidase [Anaerococcus vaginalis]|uniref:peptidase n=1 Tax=Anaerococcus vaginalis TaxID=33037 RepID=UPI0029093E21|nr:peptidase [Anaerococcus vaginalis]MDU6547327.1 peptidase [Anaerococcus vaginalis]
MNKNKKIISASLALALGVSLLIPNAKANEEKSVENALKEPVKTSETAKIEEKSAVLTEKTTINKAPVNNGTEKPADGEEKPADGEEKPADGEEKPVDGEEKPADGEEKPADGEETPTGDKEEPKDETEKPKDEKKVKPKEYKMSELLNEKGAFEKSKGAELDFMGYEIWVAINGEPPASEEEVDAMRRQYEKLQKATTWDEMAKILGYVKEKFARDLLYGKGESDAYDLELVKIIDDMANQKPQNPSQKNPNRKNKKTGTTNTANTVNTGKKVNNAGENVQTGVGSLSAILGLLGASSLGLFKSKRK